MGIDQSGLFKRIKRCAVVKKIRVWRQIRLGSQHLIPKGKLQAAERAPSCRADLVREQIRKYPQKAEQLQQMIHQIMTERSFSEADRQDMMSDMYFSYFAYGFTPNEYICYDFFEKTWPERLEFLSDRDSVRYGFQMNDIEQFPLFMDKYATYQGFQPYYKREIVCIRTPEDRPTFLSFVERHPVFIKKITNESCGRGIERLDIRNGETDMDALFQSFLEQGAIVLEECVTQHKAMSVFNASSVNTVRCITLKTKNGIITPYCFLKVGRRGSVIDNGGAGGILVGVDSASGVLNTDGVDEVGRRYPAHPDSGVVFSGFALPEWEHMTSICTEMAEQVHGVHCIGWDMAYSVDGWVVIEGNILTEVIGPQSTSRAGIRRSLEAYMREMDLRH